jgi:hypothetical protein
MIEITLSNADSPEVEVASDLIQVTLSNDTITYENEFVSVPAHYNSTGTAGQFSYDDDYFYVCVATDRWGKCPLIKNF